MSENLTEAHRTFNKARNEFIRLAGKTESTQKREKKKLLRQLKGKNTKIAKTKDRLEVAEKRLAEKASVAKRKQVGKIKQLLKKEMKAAAKLREDIQPLTEKLKSIADHVMSANFFRRGLEKADKEIDKLRKKKAAAVTKKAKRKTGKKPVKKKATKKKATRRKTTKRKATRRKATKKKATRRKATKRKVVKKKAAKKRSKKKAKR